MRQGVPMKLWRLLILICILLLIVACAALLDRPAEPPPDVQPTVTVPHEVPPRPLAGPETRIDDLDQSSLETAIERSLRYYDKTKNPSFWFGNREILVSGVEGVAGGLSRDSSGAQIRTRSK